MHCVDYESKKVPLSLDILVSRLVEVTASGGGCHTLDSGILSLSGIGAAAIEFS